MEKNMKTTIMGYVGTTMGIHSFILAKVRRPAGVDTDAMHAAFSVPGLILLGLGRVWGLGSRVGNEGLYRHYIPNRQVIWVHGSFPQQPHIMLASDPHIRALKQRSLPKP